MSIPIEHIIAYTVLVAFIGGVITLLFRLAYLGMTGKKKNNPNSKFTKGIHDELCTSRLEVVRTEIKGMEANIHTKLDFITEQIKEIKRG